MKPFLRVLTAVAAVLPLACGDTTGIADGPGPRIQLPRALSVPETGIIHASNDFALDLLRSAVAGDTASNVFLSPLSASMALGMAMNGAAADTWTQMRDGLGFEGMEEADINAAYRDLIPLLVDLDPKVELGLANSVWARQGYPFRQDFLDRAHAFFSAQARELDFTDPTVADTLNAWVADASKQRIRKLVDNVDRDAIMYLFNVVYFNGEWRERFDPNRTAPRPFTRDDGTSLTVDMMSGKVARRSFQRDGVLGVELPYGGDAFAAIAILPPDGQPIRDFVRNLDAASWRLWIQDLDQQAENEDTDLAARQILFPKFQITYDRLLNDDLAALGMVDAFDAVQADFTRLTPNDLPAGQGPPFVFVKDVRQKTFLKVDERGTEAAAATSVGFGGTVSLPEILAFDRPFLFAIRDRLTGTVLFIGVIGDPVRG